MWLTRNKSTIPTADEALPGRDRRIPVAAQHFVLGTPLDAPVPDGLEEIVFGLGCFWGAERMFWETDGVYVTEVGYAGGFTPNPTYEEVCSGRTGHTEVVRVVFDPREGECRDSCSRCSGSRTTRRRACGRATTVGTQYRSAIYPTTDAQRPAALSEPRGLRRSGSPQAGYSPITTEIVAGGRLLPGRGLPPAVPGQGAERLLRPRRHGRLLPGGPRATAE